MEQTPVNFKQVRDFGEIFNSTFSFIRQEFKPLLKAIAYFALPLLIIASIFGVFVNIEQQQFSNALRSTDVADIDNPWSALGPTYKYLFLTIIVYVLGMCSLQCTVIGYIRQYVLKGKDNFTMDDVWSEVKRNLLPVLGISFVVAVIIMVGFMLCIIPGVYVGVSLCFILPIFIYERIGFGDAFSRSFRLTGQKWWLTFGIILIFYILVYLFMLLLSIPAILMGMKTFLSSFRNTGAPVEFTTGFYIINSITSLLTYILISMPTIGIVLHYFSIVEMAERTSLHDKIEQIG